MTELGNKYECSECETKFYDLGREQAVCPQCGHEMQKEDPLKSKSSKRRSSAEARKASNEKKAKKASDDKKAEKAKKADSAEE